MRDISQNALEMIETLRLVEDQASKVVKIDDFVALFSQEFRNPISSAMNHLQLLSEGEFGKLNDRQAEVVLQIAADLETLANLIFVASDLVRGEHAKKRWQPKMVPVSVLTEELEAEAQVYAKPGGMRLECKIVGGIQAVNTEPVRLKIVLRSLLMSLMKTAEQGTITLEISRNKDSAVFTIADPNAILAEQNPVEIVAIGACPRLRFKNAESLRLAERLLESIEGKLTVHEGQVHGILCRVTLPGAMQ